MLRGRPVGAGSVFSWTLQFSCAHSQRVTSLHKIGHYESQVCTKSDTISFVSSKLKISVRLYLSPSHLQSLGAQLRYLGDGQNLRTRTRVLMVWKAISSFVSDFLELKLFLCRSKKKIGLCWKSAAADLWNGRWMGSACDPGLEAVRFKARGSNYGVLN